MTSSEGFKGSQDKLVIRCQKSHFHLGLGFVDGSQVHGIYELAAPFEMCLR